MQENWNILINELKHHGINILGQGVCSWVYEGKKYKSRISTKIKHLHRQFKENEHIICELFLDVCRILGHKKKLDLSAVDQINQKIFIYSLINLYKLHDLILDDSPHIHEDLIKNNVKVKIRHSLNSDITEFNSNIIKSIPDYKIALDWIYRRNCNILYLVNLLETVNYGRDRVNTVKLARGVAGPWSRLDLPMLERVYPWKDIAEEVEGRETSKETQQRYRKGLEEYNDSNHVGEGFYWRELRNEPYLWSNRFTSSPYPQLGNGTWR